MRKSFLIIQTAFTGDAILATALVEKLSTIGEEIETDLLVRKGNEGLFAGHPKIREIITWNKKEHKFRNLLKTIRYVRSKRYDVVINIQRFATTGLLTIFSGAKETRGFDKNPLAVFFSRKIKHEIKKGKHEIDRNQQLIADFSDELPSLPRLYPTLADNDFVKPFCKPDFITIAPSSVWPTKTLPPYKWIELIQYIHGINPEKFIYLLGSKEEYDTAENIRIKSGITNCINLSGQLTLLQSAALMEKAGMNYVNDSAPMHLSSAMNAPVTAIYCSTVPRFGFGPLSDQARIIETKIHLECRPCGLHGYKECPVVHFKCAHTIEIKDIIGS